MLKLLICLFFIGAASAQNSKLGKMGLRIGGKACMANPNYCQNGGTCYTQVILPSTTKAPVTMPVYKPVCGCRPAYQGNQCQVQVTTQAPTTQAPTTQPACQTPAPTPAPTTQAPTTQPACQTPAPTTQAPTTQPACQTPAPTPAPTQRPVIDLCKLYADRGMNICQNGGICQFVADRQIRCICSNMFFGQYCEQSRTPAPTNPPTKPACGTPPPYGK